MKCRVLEMMSQRVTFLCEVTWSQSGLWLVDRYLRHSVTASSGVSSSPVRFYPSGQIFDQSHHYWSITNQLQLIWLVLVDLCPQSGQCGGDLWPLVQSADRWKGGGATAGGGASRGWGHRIGDRHKQHPDHRWHSEVTVVFRNVSKTQKHYVCFCFQNQTETVNLFLQRNKMRQQQHRRLLHLQQVRKLSWCLLYLYNQTENHRN